MRIPPLVSISFGLVSMTISAMLMGNVLVNLVPDEHEQVFAYRRTLSESLALQYSALATQEDFETIELAMAQLVDRNDDILSAALVSLDETTIEATTNHIESWISPPNNQSTLDRIQIPIFQGSEQWGVLQVRFSVQDESSPLSVLNFPWVRFVAFVGFVGFVGYFTFMKRTLRHLDPSSVVPKRVKAALDNLEEGVVVLDTNDRIVLANASFSKQLGKDVSALLGTSVSALNWITHKNESKEDFPWVHARKNNQPETGIPLVLSNASGEHRKLVVNSSPIADNRGSVTGVLTSFSDVTELDQANAQLVNTLADLNKTQAEVMEKNKELKHLATRDPLTGCLNRRAFFADMDKAFAQAQREGSDLGCIMTDIDHFKSFNDQYGHALGDQVIQAVAKHIGARLRPHDFLGRYGGEEFCVILPGLNIEETAKVAERIRRRIEAEAGRAIRTTPGLHVASSFGVSALGCGATGSAALVDQADQALYVAKECGRNRVIRWDEPHADLESLFSDISEEAPESAEVMVSPSAMA